MGVPEGNRTDKGVTMPLRGRAVSLLGATMVDVGMNDASFWRGIPEQVWECWIGGHQVLKKWLSYRDHSSIARPLSAEEVGHVQQVARRIAAVLLLGLRWTPATRIAFWRMADGLLHSIRQSDTVGEVNVAHPFSVLTVMWSLHLQDE